VIPAGIPPVDGLTAVLSLVPTELVDVVRQLTGGDVADKLGEWLRDAARSLVRIVLVVIIALVVLRLLRAAVGRIVAGVLSAQGEPTAVLRQRADTLGRVAESTGRVVVIVIAMMMILTNLGMDIGPLIASAGLAGIAIGLGAQSLVRDMINGFFILFEDQFGVGDVITVGAESGTVETIDLRRTVLRAVDGSQIIIPNGEIRVLQNQSKGWSRAVLDIQTAPYADDAQVVSVLHEVLDGIQQDPLIGGHILEPPQVLGVTSITATGVTFRVLVKTEPLQQWAVERELRLRIREAFRRHQIPVPAVATTISPGEPG